MMNPWTGANANILPDNGEVIGELTTFVVLSRGGLPRATQDDKSKPYFRLTSVRSTNQDCGETKPVTFLLKARGLRSWTM